MPAKLPGWLPGGGVNLLKHSTLPAAQTISLVQAFCCFRSAFHCSCLLMDSASNPLCSSARGLIQFNM